MCIRMAPETRSQPNWRAADLQSAAATAGAAAAAASRRLRGPIAHLLHPMLPRCRLRPLLLVACLLAAAALRRRELAA